MQLLEAAGPCEVTHPRCRCEGYPHPSANQEPDRASNKEGESWAIIAKLSAARSPVVALIHNDHAAARRVLFECTKMSQLPETKYMSQMD